MCKVFLGVPLEDYGHVEDRLIGKLDLEAFWRFLGGHQICLGDVRDGWPTAQLPSLALQILQSLGALEGGTQLGMLPECGAQHESLEQRSWWNLLEPCRLHGGLKKLCRE
jgi:hypothetical protein